MPRVGSKRKKARTQKLDLEKDIATGEDEKKRTPRHFVVKMGQVKDRQLQHLVRDLRNVLSPNSCSALKERRANRLRDYVHVSNHFKVTHVNSVTESMTEKGPNAYFKIGRLPQGPTVTFKINRFTTVNDVRASQKRPRNSHTDFLTAPVNVMVGFNVKKPEPIKDKDDGGDGSGSDAEEEAGSGLTGSEQAGRVELIGSAIKNCFPTLDPHDPAFSLANCRRVALWRYDQAKDEIEFRHYAVQEELVGGDAEGNAAEQKEKDASKKQTSDMVQQMLKKGFGSAKGMFKSKKSEDDSDDDSDLSDAETVFSTDTNTTSASLMTNTTTASSGEKKRARVRLTELGPRMCLSAIKAEEGLYGGGVLFHRFVQKTASEEQELNRLANKRAREKADKKDGKKVDKKDKYAVHNADNPHNSKMTQRERNAKEREEDEAANEAYHANDADTAAVKAGQSDDDMSDGDEIEDDLDGEADDVASSDKGSDDDDDGDDVEMSDVGVNPAAAAALGFELKEPAVAPVANKNVQYQDFGSSKSGSKNFHKHKGVKGKTRPRRNQGGFNTTKGDVKK